MVLFWVGLLIFDILVSTMVALNADEIKSLLAGRQSTMKIWEVIKLGEFWLIFAFGMFPLTLTHFLIDYIYKSYKKSQRDIVDAEKNRKIQLLDAEMIDLLTDKERLSIKIKEKDDAILESNTRILGLEKEINSVQTQIENKYSELRRQIKSIYDDFRARITSGRIFTEVLLDSVVTAYKSGFIEFLPEFYASNEVATRVKEIEVATINTLNLN